MKKRELAAYGAASIADAGPYSLVTVYLIVFLTTVAKLSPEQAGMVTSVTILVNGIAEGLLGYISDHTKSRFGRRRPYLLASLVPLGAGLILLFTVFEGSPSVRMASYLGAGFLFWAGFGMYFTPYSALGAELTCDYSERSILRTCARIFGLIGNILGMVLPLTIVSFLSGRGCSEAQSWKILASLMAVCACSSILITWNSTRGKEQTGNVGCSEEGSRVSILGLLKDYWSILKLKPYKYLIGVIIFFMAANTFYNSSMVFFARYTLGIRDEITSAVFLISLIANFIYTPILGWGSAAKDKKHVVAAALAAAGLGCLCFFFSGIDSYAKMVAYVCVFSLAYAAYWQLFNSLLYDLSEVGEYVLGKRTEGSIMSVYGLISSISTSVATQAVGWILGMSGYNAAIEVQSQSAQMMINYLFTLVPGVCLLVAAALQQLYPLNKKRFQQLKQAISEKDKKESIPSELKRII